MDDGFLGKTPPEKIFRSESSASGGLLDPLIFIDFPTGKTLWKFGNCATLQIAKCFNTHFGSDFKEWSGRYQNTCVYMRSYLYIYTRILIHIEREREFDIRVLEPQVRHLSPDTQVWPHVNNEGAEEGGVASKDPKTVCGENTKPQNWTGMIQWICWMLSRWKALLVLIVNIFLASLILWNAACQANWVFMWRTNMRQGMQGDPPSYKLVYKPIQL